ncbi:response regulator [Oceanicoccus sagamiensis]|uniref:Two-component system response regulator n=1 Tax=Oceanicoccus sagamiensis TaxID=716816 RepID=A0A1X9NID7_9GAMM|nr:response regulator [Oceanicoccus sagamiensis]ARN74657.1 two-component system response regulator [Oceanicoccus sagamiensis]
MSKTIMIVDDSSSIRTLVSMCLKNAGYTVMEAENGRVALDKLSASSAQLVISDVNMPVMDGIEFVTELKKLPDYRFTPVLMLTTESEADKREAGKKAGARAWVVKPFKEDQMLTTVKKLIM